MIWEIWWAWVAFGVGLAILEVLVPGFIFLGFAAGAVLVGLLMLAGLALTLAWYLLVFAVVSLVAWVALRQAFGVRLGQVKTFNHDINED